VPCCLSLSPSGILGTCLLRKRAWPSSSLTFRYDFERPLYTFRTTEKKRFIIKFVILPRVVFVPMPQRGLLIRLNDEVTGRRNCGGYNVTNHLSIPRKQNFIIKMGQNVSPKRRNVILRFKNPEFHWSSGRRDKLTSVYYCRVITRKLLNAPRLHAVGSNGLITGWE
jgi:hypothetical protein